MRRVGRRRPPRRSPQTRRNRCRRARAASCRTFRQALLTNALNPKVAIFFLALLPQFIDANAPSKTLAFLFLGACFIVQGFAFLALFALLVAPLRRWKPSGTWRRSLQAGGGLLFAGLAARLATRGDSHERARHRCLARHRPRARAPVPRRRRQRDRLGPRRGRPRARARAGRDADPPRRRRRRQRVRARVADRRREVRRRVRQRRRLGRTHRRIRSTERSRFRCGDAHQRARADARDSADRRGVGAECGARRAVVAHGLDRQPHEREQRSLSCVQVRRQLGAEGCIADAGRARRLRGLPSGLGAHRHGRLGRRHRRRDERGRHAARRRRPCAEGQRRLLRLRRRAIPW